MNTQLLEKIREQILAEPTRFDMSRWIGNQDRYSNCGTTACIAGWAVATGREEDFPSACRSVWRDPNRRDYEQHGAQLLGLTRAQAQRLFYVDNWPITFAKEWYALGQKFRAENNPVCAQKVRAAMTAHRAFHRNQRPRIIRYAHQRFN